MACRLHVTRDERLTDYHFGPGHPLAPVRVELTMRLAHEFGLRALTISLHQHPAALFSFTGLPSETGGPGAEGSAVNVALPAGTGDAPWLRASHAVVPPLLARFRPQILVSQHGADTHRRDPLARLELSIDGQRAARAATHALAHDLAGGRWLLTGAGGHDLVQVVPRKPRPAASVGMARGGLPSDHAQAPDRAAAGASVPGG